MPSLTIDLKDHEFAKLHLLAEEQHRSDHQQAEVLVIEGLKLSLKGPAIPSTAPKGTKPPPPPPYVRTPLLPVEN